MAAEPDSALGSATVSERVDADGMLTQRVNAAGFQEYWCTARKE